MIGLVATTCPFPISGISPSESGEFCFRFRVLLFYATQVSMKKLLAEKKVEVAEREKKPPEVGAPSKRPSMGVDD